MAKIDMAYSEEIKRVIDAFEANELWIEGALKDKRAFKCTDESCNARITCKNMDTFANKRKVNPHFIMSSRENTHSATCKVYKEFEEKTNLKKSIENGVTKQYIGKEVSFHLQRPNNHRIIEREVVNHNRNNIEVIKGENENKKEGVQGHISHYYLLNSLILYYIRAYKEGTIEQDKVIIDFGKNRKFNYTLNKLFKRIKNENEITDKDRNHYIFYGKGKFFCRSDGGYDLVYNEKFNGSNRRVKCILKKSIIDACIHGKANKMDVFNSAVGKERFIYVLSSKNVNPKYDTIFLNVENLDCVAISEVDLDSIADIGYEGI